MLNDVYKISMFDIKPNNIMVVDENKNVNQIEFVLVDFGLASSMTHHSYEWYTSGTPGYVCYNMLNNDIVFDIVASKASFFCFVYFCHAAFASDNTETFNIGF